MKHPIKLILSVIVTILLIFAIAITVIGQNKTETNVDYEPIYLSLIHISEPTRPY